MLFTLSSGASKDVKYQFVELPGYMHEWPVWRQNLLDFVPRLFK